MKNIEIIAVILAWCISQAYCLEADAEISPGSPTPQKKQSLTHKEKEYVGSKTCSRCHLKYYEGWKTTLHSKMEQEVIPHGPNITVKGNFSQKDPIRTFELEDVDLVVGSRFKQRYSKKIGDDWYMLPAQWNVKAKKWVKYHPKNDWWAKEGNYSKEWDQRPTSKLCEGCHTVGFNIETKEPIERNIACESCHGPGSLHIKSKNKKDIVNPIRLNHERGNMICFQCHMSGRPPKGEFETYAWPVGYKPGEDLKKYWNYAKPTGTTGYEMWAEGYAHKNRVQGNTFIRSEMYHAGVSCFTCHDPHGSRHASFTVKSTRGNSLCLTCHGENSSEAVFTKSLSEHTHHAPESTGSKCIECHMPKTGKNANKWDARDHSFTFISPVSTKKSGVPNGCNNCHNDKTTQWAIDQVAKWKYQ